MGYVVSYGIGSTIEESRSQLRKEVEGYMKEGFNPHGSVQVDFEGRFFLMFQAMIKED